MSHTLTARVHGDQLGPKGEQRGDGLPLSAVHLLQLRVTPSDVDAGPGRHEHLEAVRRHGRDVAWVDAGHGQQTQQ